MMLRAVCTRFLGATASVGNKPCATAFLKNTMFGGSSVMGPQQWIWRRHFAVEAEEEGGEAEEATTEGGEETGADQDEEGGEEVYEWQKKVSVAERKAKEQKDLVDNIPALLEETFNCYAEAPRIHINTRVQALMYKLYLTNPRKWNTANLGSVFKVPQARAAGAIVLMDHLVKHMWEGNEVDFAGAEFMDGDHHSWDDDWEDIKSKKETYGDPWYWEELFSDLESIKFRPDYLGKTDFLDLTTSAMRYTVMDEALDPSRLSQYTHWANKVRQNLPAKPTDKSIPTEKVRLTKGNPEVIHSGRSWLLVDSSRKYNDANRTMVIREKDGSIHTAPWSDRVKYKRDKHGLIPETKTDVNYPVDPNTPWALACLRNFDHPLGAEIPEDEVDCLPREEGDEWGEKEWEIWFKENPDRLFAGTHWLRFRQLLVAEEVLTQETLDRWAQEALEVRNTKSHRRKVKRDKKKAEQE